MAPKSESEMNNVYIAFKFLLLPVYNSKLVAIDSPLFFNECPSLIIIISPFQMILYLAEASRHIGCSDLFKEPSKYAWSDSYEDHFIVPYQRTVLITNKRVMLLQVRRM